MSSYLVRPKRTYFGYGKAVVAGGLLPIAWIYFSITLTAQLIRVLLARVRRSALRAGQDSPVGISQTYSLIAIPLIGVFSSVGISYGFYTLADTKGIVSDKLPAGWWAIGWTVIYATTAVILFVRTLVRHERGIDILPFEANVHGIKAISTIQRLRESTSGFFPGRSDAAYQLADEKIKQGVKLYTEPSFRQVASMVFKKEFDRRQGLIIVSLAVLWFVVPFIFRPQYRWEIWLPILAVSGLIIGSSIVMDGLSSFYDQYNWARRIEVLENRTSNSVVTQPDIDTLNLAVNRLTKQVERFEEITTTNFSNKTNNYLKYLLGLNALMLILSIRNSLGNHTKSD